MFPATTASKTSRQPQLRLSLFARFLAWRETARQKARLRLLDDRLLSDIGITRTMAEAETERSAWDSPAHWHD
ncbi:DUF1127 domain-containing protein [Neotabrizicola sp. sgz301269]|uniref:DUF1127 domain-containing protein n=1 Tax=Neotabrizicola sp. sgz301269 TaxID=3276282 RepID=UPI00376FDE93